MTRQTWTAALSALLFVVLAAVIALVPVPYVTWAPGATYNLLGKVGDSPAISITGAQSYPTSGELLMTTISVTAPDSTLSLPEILISYFMPAREVLPRQSVYRTGASASEITSKDSQLMVDSQDSAVVAALRQADIEVTELPVVSAVQTSGAAAGILKPGDLIVAVDDVPVTDPGEVKAAVKSHNVGQEVSFTVKRDGATTRQTVTTRATSQAPDVPVVGIEVAIGYEYEPKVTFAVDPEVGGSSAGLMFSLAIYDQLQPTSITGGQIVAGTGTMSVDGTVGPIGGVEEKLAAASRDKATIFLLPKGDCSKLGAAPAGVRLVPVTTLGDAVSKLAALQDPTTAASVQGCQ
jgi:Lon-like protease